jgi:anti-anti-sigma regulatory factor
MYGILVNQEEVAHLFHKSGYTFIFPIVASGTVTVMMVPALA